MFIRKGRKMKLGAVILAGGKSRRMGEDKAELKTGGRSFLEIISGELSGFDELLLSVDDAGRYTGSKLCRVGDVFPGCGPMGGLHAALTACNSDVLLAVSCDLPLFTKALGESLCAGLAEGYDAVVPKTDDGRIHPLCAVYRKSCAAVFEKFLAGGNYRMTDALKAMNVKYINGLDDRQLQNINTREEYSLLLEKGDG